MQLIKNQIFKSYDDLISHNSTDESEINFKNCTFDMENPLWHKKNINIDGSKLSESCCNAICYSDTISLNNTQIYGEKALRECANININECSIDAQDFGWSSRKIKLQNTSANSDFFMMNSYDIDLQNVTLNGNYSLQHIENAVFSECNLNSSDILWHSENVTIKESIIKGKCIGWYSDRLTLINCIIIGSQPFCFCKKLRMVNCEMHDTDLSFESSDVTAEIKTNILSVKNPLSGTIIAPSVGEIIADTENSRKIIHTL